MMLSVEYSSGLVQWRGEYLDVENKTDDVTEWLISTVLDKNLLQITS